jgi:hypothetical protein
MNIFKFGKQNDIGRFGEVKMKRWFRKRNPSWVIKDVSTDPYYRTLDIDWLVTQKNGTIAVEVKTDTTKSNNIFYETWGDIEEGRLGCMDATYADLIIYFYPNLNLVYILETRRFRYWVNKNIKTKQEYKRTLKNKLKNGREYTTEGYIVPRKMLNNLPFVKLLKYEE